MSRLIKPETRDVCGSYRELSAEIHKQIKCAQFSLFLDQSPLFASILSHFCFEMPVNARACMLKRSVKTSRETGPKSRYASPQGGNQFVAPFTSQQFISL
jgi:hypothetical protein